MAEEAEVEVQVEVEMEEEEEEKVEECFRKGAQVEVCLDDDGFRGSWYSATVLRTPSKTNKNNNDSDNKRKDKILLEFHGLTSDEEGKKPLRESVDLILVRPIPPRENLNRKFNLNEDVDASQNDGWWEGVITYVLEGGRYSVYFRSSREQLEFPGSDLRLHREWVYGNWVPPLEEDQVEAEKPN